MLLSNNWLKRFIYLSLVAKKKRKKQKQKQKKRTELRNSKIRTYVPVLSLLSKMIVELAPIADFIPSIYFIKYKENTNNYSVTDRIGMGILITETDYRSLYHLQPKKKKLNRNKKKVQS